MWLSKNMIQTHPNQMRFLWFSIYVGSVCSFSIGLVWFWTPLFIYVSITNNCFIFF